MIMPISNPLPATQAPLYVRLSPRFQEWDNIDVSAAGISYQLQSVPADKTVIAHLLVHPGLALLDGDLILSFEPTFIDETNPSGDPRGGNFFGDTASQYRGETRFTHTRPLLIPTQDARIWAQRSGDYRGSRRTSLWVLGWFEGFSLQTGDDM